MNYIHSFKGRVWGIFLRILVKKKKFTLQLISVITIIWTQKLNT